MSQIWSKMLSIHKYVIDSLHKCCQCSGMAFYFHWCCLCYEHAVRNKRLFSSKFRNGFLQGSNSNWTLWPSQKPVVCGGTNGYPKATVWCGCGGQQFVCCWRQRWTEDAEYCGMLQSEDKTVESSAIHEYPSSWIGCGNFERPSVCCWWPWWLVLLEYCWEVRSNFGTLPYRGRSFDLYAKVNLGYLSLLALIS